MFKRLRECVDVELLKFFVILMAGVFANMALIYGFFWFLKQIMELVSA